MARPIRIAVNPLLVQELRNAPGIGRILKGIVAAVEDACVADPRSESETGTYRSSFGTDVARDTKGFVGTVYNTDPTAQWVEFGAHAGGKTPILGYFIMTRALDAVVGQGKFAYTNADPSVDYGDV